MGKFGFSGNQMENPDFLKIKGNDSDFRKITWKIFF